MDATAESSIPRSESGSQWRALIVLLMVAMVAAFAKVPYALHVYSDAKLLALYSREALVAILIVVKVGEALLLSSLSCWGGLGLGLRLGLGAPLLRAWLLGEQGRLRGLLVRLPVALVVLFFLKERFTFLYLFHPFPAVLVLLNFTTQSLRLVCV